MINFNKVQFNYPNFKIKEVSFNIKKGEIVAITGNNASGKTTVLNLIAGLIKPKKGEVLVFGKKPVCGKGIGMVFQNPDNQIIFSTVEDDIKFTLKNQKIPKQEWAARTAEALSLVHLNGYEKHDTASLSAGQKQRLVIANMLATKPELLIFDEVSVYLDPAARREFFNLFSELKENGITIVFATNLLDEITFADKVMIVDSGEVKALSTKQEVIKDLSVFKALNIHVPLKLEILSKIKEYSLTSDDQILNALWRKIK